MEFADNVMDENGNIIEEVEEVWKELEDNSICAAARKRATIRFAKEWAERMESEIQNGRTVEEVAENSMPGDHGITGKMYYEAVVLLTNFWKYGSELRRWHNLKVQYCDEGEIANEAGYILNPTRLVFTKKG